MQAMGTEKRKKTVRHTKKNEAGTLQSKDAELAIESHEEGSFILWHSLVCLVLFVAVYVKCTSVSIPSGDAGDFVMTAYHFGVAHPPGYPTDLRPTSDRRPIDLRPTSDQPPTNLRPTSDQPPTNLRPTSDQPPTGVHLPPTDLRPTSDRPALSGL